MPEFAVNRRDLIAGGGVAFAGAALVSAPARGALPEAGDGRIAMTPETFEDHVWKDVVSEGDLRIYARQVRDVYVGRRPALLAIDLYNSVYRGGDRPVLEVISEFPASCGEYAWKAIPPTTRLMAAARKAAIPIVYSTGAEPNPQKLRAALTDSTGRGEDPYTIFEAFTPHESDRIIYKERASAFFGTPLQAYLQQRGVDSVIICGETTSGCVRASALDAFSAGFHVVLAEECCFDRILLSHKINLFDLHHKYADVMYTEQIIRHLEAIAQRQA